MGQRKWRTWVKGSSAGREEWRRRGDPGGEIETQESSASSLPRAQTPTSRNLAAWVPYLSADVPPPPPWLTPRDGRQGSRGSVRINRFLCDGAGGGVRGSWVESYIGMSTDNIKGLILALSSSLFSGASFIIKKKGLKKASAFGVRAGMEEIPLLAFFLGILSLFLLLVVILIDLLI